MKNFRIILIIGVIEILIGVVTLASTAYSLASKTNTKNFTVLFSVIVASIISTLLGVGILKFKKLAYDLLLYFSSVVLLSKLLIFMDVIHLNGSLETSIPAWIKNWTSVAYHGFVIYYFKKADIRQVFHHHEE